MPWPQAPDYAEAIQNLSVSFRDPMIQAGRVEVNRLGQPRAWSGNFATVFQVRSASGRNWAVKCFTREVPALQERYREIDAHLRSERLPFTVRFDYVPAGLLVQGRWHPFLRMDWVEGESLDAFVADSLQKGTHRVNLRLLGDMWLRLAQRLRESRVAHGDLQHGNVILVPLPESKSYVLKLIDYDGMFVPGLANNPAQEVGHGAYQHPDRLYRGGYGPEIDQFSHLVICTTLQCLMAEGESLWEKYYTGDNLLFGRQDFEEPERSPLFHRLWNLSDGPARTLAGHLLLAAKGRLEDVPRVEELILDSSVTSLTVPQERRVEELLSRGAGQVRRVPQFGPAWPTPAPAPPAVRKWWTQPVAPAVSGTSGVALPAQPLPLPPGVSPARPQPVPRPTMLGRLINVPRNLWARLTLGRKIALALLLVTTTIIAWEVAVMTRVVPMRDFLRHPIRAIGQLLKLSSVPPSTPADSDTSHPRGTLYPPPLNITVESNSIGMEMVLIPAGEFTMGSSDGKSDESPPHKVRITKPFYLGQYEVTVGQFGKFVDDSKYDAGRFWGSRPWIPSERLSDDHPVTVSWDDAKAFCDWLSKKEGKEYRLPTEAEWEYTCRAGTQTTWSFGDDPKHLGDYAVRGGPEVREPQPVGQKKPNAWGLYDMLGNVKEFCADWYDANYYASSPADDPKGPSSGAFRVLRGGSYGDSPGTAPPRSGKWLGGPRSADRQRGHPTNRPFGSRLGFRVARTP